MRPAVCWPGCRWAAKTRAAGTLRFTGSYPDSGRRYELLTLPDGCAVDLLGMDR
jgi:hypothetical protein